MGSLLIQLKSKFCCLVVLVLASLSACQNPSPSKIRDPLESSYQHIDREEYDLAIEELTLLSETDTRPEVLVTLASAYAARGGIKVQQYWGFVIGFRSPLLSVKDLRVNPTVDSLKKVAKQADGNVSATDLEALGGVIRALTLWDLYKERIDAIPVVEGAANDDILAAVETLSSVHTPGGRLYRAILDLILFKSAATTGEQPWNGFGKVLEKTLKGDTHSLCEFDFGQFTSWLRPLSERLDETLSDLAIAFPEQQPTLQPAQAQVREMDATLTKARAQLRKRKACQ